MTAVINFFIEFLVNYMLFCLESWENRSLYLKQKILFLNRSRIVQLYVLHVTLIFKYVLIGFLWKGGHLFRPFCRPLSLLIFIFLLHWPV